MALLYKHEAVLTFVGRLVRDQEFSEWFVARPGQALASHGLSPRDVHDLADVLATERQRRQLAVAMQPIVTSMLAVIDDAARGGESDDVAVRFARFQSELTTAHDRVAVARAENHPWWKFW